MSIIQQLRDKAAVLLIALIAISLIGFLVQDAFIGRSKGLFSSGPSSTVGSINGSKIDAIEYNDKVRAAEEGYKSRGYQVNDQMTQSIQESIWNSYVQQKLIEDQAEKLGLSFTPKELESLLFTENAPPQFKQLFTNQQTGQFDVSAARNWFSGLKKSKQADQIKMVNEQLLDPIVLQQLVEKYTAIFTQGSYVPKWMIEKINAENSAIAGISYVGVPYNTVSDSSASVKVSDAEISEYIEKHKADYKQQTSRSISYVVFDATPSTQDSNVVRSQLITQKPEFAQSTDDKTFVTRNGTTLPFYDGFVLKSKLQMAAKDSIIALPLGGVYGPYLDEGSYVLAKKIEVRNLPDTVKCRHILIGTVDPNSGQQIRDDSSAKKLADSLFTAIKGGARWDSLAKRFSDDPGSKDKAGEYEFGSNTNLAKEFKDFIFYKKPGDRDVIKTEFGYHVIEVLSQKKFEEAYKVAYLAKKVLTSPETDNAASSAATQFSANSRSLKAFDENVMKDKLNKRLADNIGEMDFSVSGGIGDRTFVKWIYDNKVGDVSEPFDFRDKYVVAVITGATDEGVQSASSARLVVEPMLRNQKKAAEIIKKIGKPNSLDAVATANSQQVNKVDTVRFSAPLIPNLGNEPKVIGAAFFKENQNKVSAPIEGQSGVFVIQTNYVSAVPALDANAEGQKRMQEQQLKQMAAYGTMESLRKSATVKDTRRKAGY